ncbi:MAG TPA: (2Fe-2S) ferredoxin domain-containing protein [Leptolyngbyaceae cyanobacterium M33_DOE_097]|uniref:(2Fe-2S) ferredoxin domain-containing protein n=1 Tax=Oscillatoriales cyanobacterium SpSt-418 TaxID=2282169 RepID=A0A7C3KII5_9CYAN|nr:(2Fe-2S) ferredoxin domain-containing protein [Leptolyngbyaceae cyanobacterium M33_DOE_097]
MVNASAGVGDTKRDRQVLICQNRTCLKQGSAAVLAKFLAVIRPNVTVIPTGCLGQCGSGPVVLLLPDKVWLHSVLQKDVPAIAERYCLKK